MASATESEAYPSLAWINKVYDDLRQIGDSYFQKERTMIDMKDALERRISLGLLTGEIGGKNDRERDAAALQLYGDDFDRLGEAMMITANAKHELQNAQIEEQRLKMIMRVFELKGTLATSANNPPRIFTLEGEVT